MFKTAFCAVVVCSAGLLAISVSSARDPPATTGPLADAADETLSAELVKTGLYLISSSSGNSLMRLSARGSILVDGQRPHTYRTQMSQVRKISKLSDLPVRALILTDHHENHAGNAVEFESAGVPLIAQENLWQRISLDTAGPIGHAGGGPTQSLRVSYAGDYVLQMGGVQMKLIHFGNAYTDEDTVVYFPDLKVVAIGDLFTFGLPEPDYLAGGSLVAWGPVIARILELDFDVVVPGKGRVVTRRELEAFEARINTMVARARELVKNGVSRDLLATQLETDDLGWHWNLTGSELDGFYAELARMQ
jgi:glyoxylase-like metal-dependent hydrolase (beta-lactamase superfamily II)